MGSAARPGTPTKHASLARVTLSIAVSNVVAVPDGPKGDRRAKRRGAQGISRDDNKTVPRGPQARTVYIAASMCMRMHVMFVGQLWRQRPERADEREDRQSEAGFDQAVARQATRGFRARVKCARSKLGC
jgi:hypothetical protein